MTVIAKRKNMSDDHFKEKDEMIDCQREEA